MLNLLLFEGKSLGIHTWDIVLSSEKLLYCIIITDRIGYNNRIAICISI